MLSYHLVDVPLTIPIIPGFFYVKNYGISDEEVNRQFALGRDFYNLPLEEKLKFHNSDDLVSKIKSQNPYATTTDVQ